MTVSRPWKYTSGFCELPRSTGWSGLSARCLRDDQFLVDQFADGVGRDVRDFVDLVRGAETVEEMQEGHARAQGGHLCDQGEVQRLLHAGRAQHGIAGHARGHHVRVVAEDGQGLGRDRARRDVQHRRGQLARDLVHVRDHQQQPLGGGEAAGQRTPLQRAMGGPGGASLALHLDHLRYHAQQIVLPARRPFVGPFTHW